MGLRFSCPCGRPYNLKSSLAGRFVRCKTCEELIEVPGAAVTEEGPVVARLAADAAKSSVKKAKAPKPAKPAEAAEPAGASDAQADEPAPVAASDRKGSARFPCEEHPHKAATGACDGCGRRLCSACLDRLEDTNLCRACLLARVSDDPNGRKGIGKKIKKITDWFRKAAVEPSA